MSSMHSSREIFVFFIFYFLHPKEIRFEFKTHISIKEYVNISDSAGDFQVFEDLLVGYF
jgi:hypothetical protein